MKQNLAIAVMALVLITSVIGGSMVLGGNSNSTEADHTNSNAAQATAAEMSVENVEVINRSEGVITADVTFNGTIDVDKLKRSLSSLFSDRQTNISSITIANVSGDVATV